MTIYKRNLLTWVCIMFVELTLGAMGIYLSKWCILPFFAGLFVVPHVLEKIVCPNCRTPVTYQGTLAAVRIEGGFIRRKCQQCGWDLNKEP